MGRKTVWFGVQLAGFSLIAQRDCCRQEKSRLNAFEGPRDRLLGNEEKKGKQRLKGDLTQKDYNLQGVYSPLRFISERFRSMIRRVLMRNDTRIGAIFIALLVAAAMIPFVSAADDQGALPEGVYKIDRYFHFKPTYDIQEYLKTKQPYDIQKYFRVKPVYVIDKYYKPIKIYNIQGYSSTKPTYDIQKYFKIKPTYGVDKYYRASKIYGVAGVGKAKPTYEI
jgi:hypothetical protein